MKQLLATAQAWWQSITPREQRLVMIGGALLVLAVLYWGILSPLHQRAAEAEARISTEKQLLSWTREKANQITTLRASGGVTSSTQPLNQIVSSTAGRYNIELIRVQPRSEMLQVWIQPVAFDQFLNWVSHLKSDFGVEVEFLDIERADKAGVVEIKRLQFKRG
ncbi:MULTISPECIES: type II secretion system protein M [Vibrio]|uniref:Type II secretion system protein M n=1 Tax=Vibrio proteolyticus NBRC 13287 TaxID=1219065 RepID=U2ZZ15_VIBPR|nr:MULTISPECIES: type II secretion system protein M [Vibrio]NAW58346.1 type II secretion system protein M [Vibrio sp. V36_P2S2PM302]NAX22426.1 type II secretion system protein M [Vibrio sp. V39_P1S14PM300]NAX25887.1 type II secretion system protein M [Vibrio sp. V38_P2S17PM301]NAX29842.1 type II secretion system protein M [Vibrio sp. V37_P2S8PM304]GAD66680.1 type II secretion system protein M [Vibrio proteolyticus NBRC 13287]